MTIKKCAREGCNKLFHLKNPNQQYCSLYCSKESEKDRTRERLRRHRQRWPLEQRKTDQKNGTGYLSGKPKPNLEDEEYEISKEFKRLKLNQNWKDTGLIGE